MKWKCNQRRMIAAPPPPDEENAGGSVGKIAVKDEERTESEGGAVKGEEASKKRKLEALEALHANGTLDEKGEAFSGAFPANSTTSYSQMHVVGSLVSTDTRCAGGRDP